MSCTFAHNTNLSLISWLPESLETELSAFHQRNFFFFPLSPSLQGLSVMRNIQEHSDICMQLWCQAPQMKSVGPCHCLVAACGAKCSKHTFYPQITCELFFLDHYPIIESLFAQESV